MTIASAGPPDPGPATTPSRKTPEYLNARPWGRGFSPSQHPVHHEFMALGSLEPIPPSPRSDGPPRPHPYGLVHYACSIVQAVATECTDDEMPVYRRWKGPIGGATG